MISPLELRSIHLRVAQLERSSEFYARQLGFAAVNRAENTVALSTSTGGAPLLTLVEDRHAVPAPRDAAGLFHAALLLPSRAALGQWLQFAADQGVAFDGFSDHGVSEAVYLSDPDGNGLEFYADRPREAWPFEDGELAMGTLPLDVSSLVAAGKSAGTPAVGDVLRGARWGHLHLRVSNLDKSTDFYAATLGLDVMQRFGSGARFLAANGYHHHLGLNTWGGVTRPQPPGALGLIHASFAAGKQFPERAVTDPDGMAIQIGPA